jgi:hypothetical protein
MRNGIHVIQFVHLLPGISELSPGRLSVVVSTVTPRKPASGWKSEVKRGSAPCLFTHILFFFLQASHAPCNLLFLGGTGPPEDAVGSGMGEALSRENLKGDSGFERCRSTRARLCRVRPSWEIHNCCESPGIGTIGYGRVRPFPTFLLPPCARR